MALGGIDLSVVGGDLGVEGDIVVELTLIAILESDLLLREGLIHLSLLSRWLGRCGDRLSSGDLDRRLGVLVTEELLVNSGGGLVLVDRKRLVIGKVVICGGCSRDELESGLSFFNWLLHDFLRGHWSLDNFFLRLRLDLAGCLLLLLLRKTSLVERIEIFVFEVRRGHFLEVVIFLGE